LTGTDWYNLATTVIAVFGLALLSRKARSVLKIPPVHPWIPFAVYNLIWAALLIAGSRSALILPGWAAPVGLVGGNAALVNLFGFPWARRVDGPKQEMRTRRDPALDRERLEPRRKKKKRPKSRR
jgi:hypothetical protein